MMNKLSHKWIPFLICGALAACTHRESNHKNSDSQVKSAPAIIADTTTQSAHMIAYEIQSDSSFNIFARSLKATDLFDVLTKPGPFTIFLPSNKAFAGLPDGTMEGLINDRKNDLTNILSHHIVAGLMRMNDIGESQRLKTLAGEDLIVTKRKDAILINGVKISNTGREAPNGIIYTIDGLLFPINQNPGAY